MTVSGLCEGLIDGRSDVGDIDGLLDGLRDGRLYEGDCVGLIEEGDALGDCEG